MQVHRAIDDDAFRQYRPDDRVTSCNVDSQFQPAIDAAYAGDFDRFTSLLRQSPELVTGTSADPSDSPNLIQFVVVEGGLGKIPDAAKFLRFLVAAGSTTEKQLVAAASVNARELVDVLLDSGVDPKEGAPWSAVEESLYWGHRQMADYLLNLQGGEIKTLCAAAMLGDLTSIESFFADGKLSASALPVHFPWGAIEDSTEDDALVQAFVLALRHGQYEAATLLLDKGVDINGVARGHHEQCTALHQAVYLDDIAMVDWLLDRGASVDIKDRRFQDNAMGWAQHLKRSAVEAHLRRRLSLSS